MARACNPEGRSNPTPRALLLQPPEERRNARRQSDALGSRTYAHAESAHEVTRPQVFNLPLICCCCCCAYAGRESQKAANRSMSRSTTLTTTTVGEKVNLQSSHGVRQTGYGWFHGVSRVICDGYYIVLVVDHPHRWALASRSFPSSPRNRTPKFTTFRASPSTSLAAHQGGSPAWSAAPTAITASSSRRSSSARPELHLFTHRGDRGYPRPPPTQGTHSRRRSSGRPGRPSRPACASDWGDNWFYSHWQWPHTRCPTALRSL